MDGNFLLGAVIKSEALDSAKDLFSKTIQDASEELGVNEHLASLVLRYHSWDSKELRRVWNVNPGKALRKCGFVRPEVLLDKNNLSRLKFPPIASGGTSRAQSRSNSRPSSRAVSRATSRASSRNPSPERGPKVLRSPTMDVFAAKSKSRGSGSQGSSAFTPFDCPFCMEKVSKKVQAFILECGHESCATCFR